jgi:hypothetical protein
LYDQADAESQQWESLLTCFSKVASGRPITTKLIAGWMEINENLRDALENIFGDAASNQGTLKQRLARSLNDKLGRRFGDEKYQVWIESAGQAQNATRWKICTLGTRDRKVSVISKPTEIMSDRSEPAA